MKSRVIMGSFLGVIALVLVVLTAKSILRPQKYAEVYNYRRELNANRLTAIAELQKLYKKENGQYADNIDKLVDFYENGESVIKNIYLKDTVIAGITKEDIENMSMKEREEKNLYGTKEVRIPIKAKMEEILFELNDKREGENKIEMADFQYIPFLDNKKYKIEICTTDSLVQKFAIYVPVDVLLNDMGKSIVPENSGAMRRFFAKMMYENLENDARERAKCVGIQLGDTVSPSIEVKEIGQANSDDE